MIDILRGVRVLDLGRYISAPTCCRILADMGAEVIKVERNTIGDDSRLCPPFLNDFSIYFTAFNRNIFRLMRQQIEEEGTVSITTLAGHLTTEEVARLTQYTVMAVAADNELRQACDYARVLQTTGGDMTGEDPETIRRFLELNKKGQKRKE